ncbi:DNA-binding LacI/PurR family transcriptional regulator [Kibdelosporangium banguiense]|uniref:DNA-binding LacI/PurR family transcriptional regulator n=1 Tax=Kibdelosporangium banguiense TaxID=1365924 RepID=A0ABS4TRM5_9PSEU|nr:LacI family DNA-binding transcriptional regulator [Kibdelosporangium banguiense]MBP2327057.1 DNA-binding LacI/PurR family transcriptional regulator [Kibdelosporangium banguiense]
MKRVTIGDVATHAGVSTATVSRVLNGGLVAESTAARVWESAESLGYSPNALTKSIFAGRSSTIGVVIRDLSSPFYLDLIRGIDEVAAANDSPVMLANTYRRTDREAAQVQAMDQQRVRGLVITADETADNHARRMAENGTPCVIIARTAPGLHSVSLDDVAAGRLMAAHLGDCGRSRVGVLSGRHRPTQVKRAEGLRQGLSERGLPQPEEVLVENEDEVDGAVGSLLRRNDTVVCTTGRLTVSVHMALTHRGLGIPDDVGFLTMDDFPWASTLGISVVTQPSYEMGRRAAELIVEEPATPARIVFQPTLIARGSCGSGA